MFSVLAGKLWGVPDWLPCDLAHNPDPPRKLERLRASVKGPLHRRVNLDAHDRPSEFSRAVAKFCSYQCCREALRSLAPGDARFRRGARLLARPQRPKTETKGSKTV